MFFICRTVKLFFIPIHELLTYSAKYIAPILARNLPEVREAFSAPITALNPTPYYTSLDIHTNHISTRATIWAAVSGVASLILCEAVSYGWSVIVAPKTNGLPKLYGLHVGCAVSAMWFLVCMVPTVKGLKARPGPKLPEGRSIVWFSIMKS